MSDFKFRRIFARGRNLGAAVGVAMAVLGLSTEAHAAYNWTAVDSLLGGAGLNKIAIVINRNSTPIYTKGYNTWNCTGTSGCSSLSNPIAVASVSKSYSAAIVMAVLQDSSVGMSSSDSLKSWVSGASSAYSGITVAQALSMTSSIQALSELDTTNSCLGSNLWTLSSCSNNLDNTNLWPLDAYSPGAKFAYSAASWTILGQAVVNAVHAADSSVTTWAGVAGKYLLGSSKCNWAGTTYTPSRNELVSGGVYVGLFEGAAFAEMLRTGQCTNSSGTTVTILNSGSLSAMRANSTPLNGSGVPVIYWSPLNGGAGDGRGYGYGLWLNNYTTPTPPSIQMPTASDARFGVGAYGSVVFFEPSRGISGFMMVSNLNSTAFTTSVAIGETLLPLIEAQIDANP